MKRKFWTSVLVLIAALTVCGTAAAPAAADAGGPSFGPAARLGPSGSVAASAQVVPARSAHMSFALSAPVREVLVKEGDRVSAGQALMRLYAPDLELAVTQSQLELKAAELDYVYWVPRLDRPPERREQARAEVEQARMKLKIAEAEFAQTSLTAPYDATVVEINIAAGEVAQTGQVVITLADLSQMQVNTTDLSERDVPVVQIGQAVDVFIEALDANIKGRVVRISPISKEVGGDVVYPVTVELEEQPGGLLWGMTAEVNIQPGP